MGIINWSVVATIAAPIITLFLGAALDRWYEKRQRLIVYLLNEADFLIRQVGTPPTDVACRTFVLVLQNSGRHTTNNVRIGHYWLPPDVAINPAIPHTIDESAPGTAAEVRIDQLVSGEEITISYIVLAPMQSGNVISYVKSDDGPARVLNFLPTPQWPKWAQRSVLLLLSVGLVSIVYVVYLVIPWTWNALSVLLYQAIN